MSVINREYCISARGHVAVKGLVGRGRSSLPGSSVDIDQDRMGLIAPRTLKEGDYAAALAEILALRRGLP